MMVMKTSCHSLVSCNPVVYFCYSTWVNYYMAIQCSISYDFLFLSEGGTRSRLCEHKNGRVLQCWVNQYCSNVRDHFTDQSSVFYEVEDFLNYAGGKATSIANTRIGINQVNMSQPLWSVLDFYYLGLLSTPCSCHFKDL